MLYSIRRHHTVRRCMHVLLRHCFCDRQRDSSSSSLIVKLLLDSTSYGFQWNKATHYLASRLHALQPRDSWGWACAFLGWLQFANSAQQEARDARERSLGRSRHARRSDQLITSSAKDFDGVGPGFSKLAYPHSLCTAW